MSCEVCKNKPDSYCAVCKEQPKSFKIRNENIYRKELIRISERLNLLSALEVDIGDAINIEENNSFRREIKHFQVLIEESFVSIERHKKDNENLCITCALGIAYTIHYFRLFEQEKFKKMYDTLIEIMKIRR